MQIKGNLTRFRLVQQTQISSDIRKENWAQFDATLAMFNASLNLCLR